MKTWFVFFCVLILGQLLYPFLTVLWATFRRDRGSFGSYVVTDGDIDDVTQLESVPHRQNPNQHNLPNTPHFACVITAYQNIAIAQPLVAALLAQTYRNRTIYLVADECPDWDGEYSDPDFVLLRPEKPLRLKAKSLRYALEHFQKPPDFVLVLDADNLTHPDFLTALVPYIQAGFVCVQGQRTAKNLDTTYAALDSLGEHYKNYIEREVPFRLGGSAVISGSGMATETGLFTDYLHSPAIAFGQTKGKKMLQEDKILQNFLLQKGQRIAYAREALVFDGKVATGAAVTTQRSRWLYSYFQNIPNALSLLKKGIIGLNFNQLYFAGVTLALPMFVQALLAFGLLVAGFWIAPIWSLILFLGGLVFVFNLLWVLHLDQAPPEVWRALWQAPKFVFRQILGLLKMRDPQKNFKHTEHQKTWTIQEILPNSDEFNRSKKGDG